MKRFETGIKLLQWMSIIFCIAGLSMALFKDTLFAPFFTSVLYPLFMPASAIDSQFLRLENWIFSLMGSMMAVWGVLLFGVTKHALAKRESWAWTYVLLSTLAWFVVDEGFSAYYGVWLNVIGNLPLFIGLVAALLLTRKEAFGKAAKTA